MKGLFKLFAFILAALGLSSKASSKRKEKVKKVDTEIKDNKKEVNQSKKKVIKLKKKSKKDSSAIKEKKQSIAKKKAQKKQPVKKKFTKDNSDEVTLTQEQVVNISNKIDSLQTLDSLNISIISDYEGIIKDYDSKVFSDSLMIVELESQIKTHEETIELFEDKVKLVKPRWYEGKWLYFSYGAGLSFGITTLVYSIIK